MNPVTPLKGTTMSLDSAVKIAKTTAYSSVALAMLSYTVLSFALMKPFITDTSSDQSEN